MSVGEAPVPGAPRWFLDALATPYEVSEVEVKGTVVRARCWGPPGPGVVLVHGGAAHAGWWDHVAPLIAANRRVVAVDLSGHGDSALAATVTAWRCGRARWSRWLRRPGSKERPTS